MPKDACYHKVKARYRVFPSAYASGAIAKCRKVGAANYGKGGKSKSKNKRADGGVQVTPAKRPRPPIRARDGAVVARGCGKVMEKRRKFTQGARA